jgi:hypothetical protein
MPAARELSFQLERFEWVASDRLELAGRWAGLRGRRIAPPVLAFDADGERHRLRAMPGGQLDERWRATFAWDGGPVEIERAELEVGRSLVVDLPRPRRRKSADRPAEPLEEQLAAAQDDAATARAELKIVQEELGQLREDISAAAEETEKALAAEREVSAGLREEMSGLTEELQRTKGLLEHRDGQLGATRAGLEREREELRTARARVDELTEELERERWEAQRLRERIAEPSTEVHAAEDGGEEWPLEPAPLEPATPPAGDPETFPFTPDEAAEAEAAPSAGDDSQASNGLAADGGDDTEASIRDRDDDLAARIRNGAGGEPPSVQEWAHRVSGGQEEEGGGEGPRTLEVAAGLEAVKEKGAKALSSLLGRDADGEPEPAPPARPRAAAASRAGTRARPPRGTRSRTVRQHSDQAVWAMRIAAVVVLLVLVVVLAVVLDVVA